MATQKSDIHLNRTGQLRRASPVLTALVVGGLVGAGAMMLLAPNSGKETRSRIQHKTNELKDRAVGSVKGAVKQVSLRTNHLKDGVMEKAGDLQKHSREAVARELENVAEAAKRARKVVKG